jgi:hypothetical protein
MGTWRDHNGIRAGFNGRELKRVDNLYFLAPLHDFARNVSDDELLVIDI